MIFISAQPDEYYFIWQLELLTYNLGKLGVDIKNVHILFGHDKELGPSGDVANFKKNYPELQIFCYPDERDSQGYASSIRPHIIAKHLLTNPWLSNEALFYHDSDIIFRELPDFETLLAGPSWYVSNTSNYLDANYITAHAGQEVLENMCKIVGIDPIIIRSADTNAGGAQYLIKATTPAFWTKVEHDCERMFAYLSSVENALNSNTLSSNKPFVQKWCTDMWVIWWNALLINTPFLSHPELDFCWANSPIAEWHSVKILHYTGNIAKEHSFFFRKGNYIMHNPFQEKFGAISQQTASYPLTQLIVELGEKRSEKRINLQDTTFLIPVRIDSADRLSNLYASTAYLSKFFRTTIIVMESDREQKVSHKELPEGVIYIFKKTENPRLFRTNINNEMIKICSTPNLVLYDADVIIPKKQLAKAVRILRTGMHKVVSPYSGRFLNVDILLKEIFIKIQDDMFLEENKYKAGVSSMRSFGGCILINRDFFIRSGMENENLTSWGPDDLERVKRMKTLGEQTARVKGDLYHLHHQRYTDSGYHNSKEYERLMSEYLHISSMNKSELLNYIDSWTWKQ